jgi:general secretion pathway protein B
LSYILDALKKADAERERSAVPGLHAHPQDGLAETARGEGGVPWPAVAIGAIVVLGGALAWVLLSDSGVRTPPLVAAAPTVGDAAPAAAPATLPPEARGAAQPPPVAATPPSPTPATATAPAAAPAPTATPRAAPPVTAPPPVAPPTAAPPAAAPPAPAPARSRPVRPPAAATVAPRQATLPVTPAAAPAAPPAPAEPRVPWLNELPSATRSGLPPLSVSGAVYSPTPSARMLFLNGQVLREGQTTAEGVVVERIGPSSSELSAGGQRFQIRH